eukprot:TRINITY_DN865_c2_g1_i5.p1 TRINITY_DN865_c2_g1~~TRINITY_DN865_c2_g1_i5.p1  ORF type:complete len:425 (+),score=102.68 TRINITY_DN865_c2_g1_i5:192-1277(+)
MAAKYNSAPFVNKFGLPSDNVLLFDCRCSLEVNEICYPGRLYLSQDFICFYDNTFGTEMKQVIPVEDVTSITNKSKFVQLGIRITSIDKNRQKKKFFFYSFVSRSKALAKLQTIWTVKQQKSPMLAVTQPEEMKSHQRAHSNDVPNPADDLLLTEQRTSVFLKSTLQEILREKFQVGPETLFQLLFSDDSGAFAKLVHDSHNDTGLAIGPWTPTENGIIRQINYSVPVDVPPLLPLAPKTARVDETQRYVMNKNRLVIERILVMLDIPFSEDFQVESKLDCTATSEHACEVAILVGVAFNKKTTFRDTIETTTLSQSRESYVQWVSLARDFIRDRLQPTPASVMSMLATLPQPEYCAQSVL